MDIPALLAAGQIFPAGDAGLAALSAPVALAALVAACDLLLLIDGDGIVQGLAVGSRDLAGFGIENWIGRAWHDTVNPGEGAKLAELLAGSGEPGRWRQVNHSLAGGDVPMRYRTVPAAGGVVAMGRDMRPVALVQQRLLRAQQAVERDSLRLHAAEARNRLLFESASDPILLVDALTLVITDANPAAEALAGPETAPLGGRALTALVHADDRDTALALLHAIAAAHDRRPVGVRLPDGRPCQLTATLFRQDQGRALLVRLQLLAAAIDLVAERPLAAVLERVPDAFVLTDAAFGILAGNGAFLDLVGLPRSSDLRGEPLARFLGGDGLDPVSVQLRDMASLRDCVAALRTTAGAEIGIALTAVTVVDAGIVRHGFSIRALATTGHGAAEPVARSADELADLVGRMSLKDIVRESTDRIERLCIEAALAFTADNRASAAEILGLSRQSLYSKLHRHGLGNLTDNETPGG